MSTYYITTRDGDQLTCGEETDMRRIVQRMANDRGEPIYIGPEGEDSEDEEVTPVRELVLVLHRDAWGAPVSPLEHDALCRAAEAWLTDHEGDGLSIRVRPSRAGEVDGLRALRGGSPDGPDLRRSEPALESLTNRAWDHAVQSAHEILKR